MAKMGLKSDESDSSTASEESGVVSKRMSLVQNGHDVVPLEGPAPRFINIPKAPRAPEMLPVEEGIEVEGPLRPSSQYGV